MDFRLVFFPLLLFFLTVFYVSAQPVNYVISTYFFNAAPLPSTTPNQEPNFANSCMSVAPCIDTDGGFRPTVPSNVAGFLVRMEETSGFWYPSGEYSCLQTYEFCNNGRLFEYVCGSDLGINGFGFTSTESSFAVNSWTALGEPAAAFEVDCLAYAANNPQLGLNGFCVQQGASAGCI